MGGFMRIVYAFACALLASLPGTAAADDLHLFGSAEFVYLNAPAGPAGIPVSDGTPGLTSSHFDLGWTTGFDARLGVAFGSWGVEGRYLGDFAWSASATDVGAATIFSTPSINFGALDVTATESASLRSWEINGFWQATERLRVFAGYRSIDLGGSFAADIGGVATFAYTIGNELQGGQIGLEARLLDSGEPPGARFFVDARGSVGYYANSIGYAGTTSGIGGALPTFAGNGSNNTFAAEGEVRAGLALDHFRVHLGYRVLYVADIATTFGNFGSANVSTGVVSPSADGSALFHGPTAGFTLVW